MKSLSIVLLILLLLVGCSENRREQLQSYVAPPWESISISLINRSGMTVKDRIMVPEGFERVPVEASTFQYYLRSFPLKPDGSPVRYYNGETKPSKVHIAVLDIDTGDRDLQQCADAVMRLRAEYLYSEGKLGDIHFNFTNGFSADYLKWTQGYRVAINGNKTTWVKKTTNADDYDSFRKYLDIVFAYAGTASLEKELKPVDIEDIDIGDVFIKGGSPGHCVIVMDMAIKKETGEKLFLLAQSYMPAQEIHILKNPGNDENNPWYALKAGETLDTPEWDFTAVQLKRF